MSGYLKVKRAAIYVLHGYIMCIRKKYISSQHSIIITLFSTKKPFLPLPYRYLSTLHYISAADSWFGTNKVFVRLIFFLLFHLCYKTCVLQLLAKIYLVFSNSFRRILGGYICRVQARKRRKEL